MVTKGISRGAMKKCVLIFDYDFLSSISNMEFSKLHSFMDQSLTVLWLRVIIPKNALPSEFRVDRRINGTINGIKSMAHFRRLYSISPNVLALPTIFIDSHRASLREGGFDLPLCLDEYRMADSPFIKYDYLSLFNKIENFLERWRGHGGNDSNECKDSLYEKDAWIV